MTGKKMLFRLAGMFLASAVLVGCQNSRSNYTGTSPTGTGLAQGQNWGGSGATMSRPGTTTGMTGGTMVSQNSPTTTSNSWPGQGAGTMGTGGTTMNTTPSFSNSTMNYYPGNTSTTAMGSRMPAGSPTMNSSAGYSRDTGYTGMESSTTTLTTTAPRFDPNTTSPQTTTYVPPDGYQGKVTTGTDPAQAPGSVGTNPAYPHMAAPALNPQQ